MAPVLPLAAYTGPEGDQSRLVLIGDVNVTGQPMSPHGLLNVMQVGDRLTTMLVHRRLSAADLPPGRAAYRITIERMEDTPT